MNNKIMSLRKKAVVLIGFLLLFYVSLPAQHLPVSPYGLPYINSVALYRKSLSGHPDKEMISLLSIPGIILDLRYASDDNFMHKKLYPGNTKLTFMRKPAFRALDSVSKELAKHGMVLMVFDAYRPYSITVSLWNSVRDERYAANPAKGSGHNRGLAIDLTMADAKTGQVVPMPTGFDNFSDTAHQDYKETDVKRKTNRDLLRKTMEKYGFESLSTEWWHFSWPDTEEFEVLDLTFDQLNTR